MTLATMSAEIKEDGTGSKYEYYVGKSRDLFDRKFRETSHVTRFMGRVTANIMWGGPCHSVG